MLKKEFKRKDVERVRNLVKGNVNDSAELQVGYTAKKENHKEGDIWEEGGKKWTIKDGIKRTISKLNSVRKETFIPLSCPKCNKIMKKRLDKPNLPLFCPSCGSLMKRNIDTKMYNIHKKCFDCVTKMEHKLRVKGEYEEYERNAIANNVSDYVDHLESYLMEAINSSNTQFISERGEIERWKGGLDKKQLSKDIKESVSIAKENIEKYRNNDKT